MFQMGPYKAPGPGGFPVIFFQRYWFLLKKDIVRMVSSFFSSIFLLKDLNESFITLIPKNQSSQSFNEFRPIGLCNVAYKIISKVMVNRLQAFMKEWISLYQNAFVKGRLISDNIFMASKLMNPKSKENKIKLACSQTRHLESL